MLSTELRCNGEQHTQLLQRGLDQKKIIIKRPPSMFSKCLLIQCYHTYLMDLIYKDSFSAGNILWATCKLKIHFRPETQQTEILVSSTWEKNEFVGVSFPVGILPELWIFHSLEFSGGFDPRPSLSPIFHKDTAGGLLVENMPGLSWFKFPLKSSGVLDKKSKIHLEPLADAVLV